MTVKQRPLLSAVFAVAVVLASVGSGLAQIEITVNTFSGQQVMHDWLEWLTQKYMDENPDVKVDWVHAAGDKVTTMLAGGVGPDIIHLGQNWGDQIVYLSEIDQFLAKSPEVTADLIPALQGLFEFQGSTWGVPFSASTWGMAINETLLEKHAISPPDRNWTWSEAMEIMKSITQDTDGDGMPDTWGVALWWQPWNLLAYGGSLYTEDGRNSNMANSARIQAADLYLGIYSGREGVMPSGYVGVEESAADLFNSGRLGFLEMGIFQIPAYRENMTQQWSVQHYPYLEHDGELLTGGSYTLEGYGVNRFSKHPEEAWRFLAFMYEHENLAALVQKGAIMPPKMPLVDDFLEFHDQPRNVRIYLEALDYHERPSNHPAFGAVFSSMWSTIWNSDRGHDLSEPAEYLIDESHVLTQRALDEFFEQFE